MFNPFTEQKMLEKHISSRYRTDKGKEAKPRDVVFTPDWAAKEIIDRYVPKGSRTGRANGFEFGWACGCVHLQRGYHGGVTVDCEPNL